MRLHTNQFPTGGQPIVTSDDIVNVSNSNQIGNILSKTLESQQEDINELKSNVKWLYKYGGVGSGGSGGGGTSTNWTATVLINRIYKVSDGNTISLNGSGSYPLSISISRPNGRRFKAKIGFMSNKKHQEYSMDLYLDNEWSGIQYLNIVENTVLTVTITDDDMVSTTMTASLVTEPYTLSLDYVDQSINRLPYSSNSSVDDIDIFMNDAISKGVDVELSYDAAINAAISYNVEQNFGIEDIVPGQEYELITMGQGLKSGKKYFTIPSSLFENPDNAGTYEFTANFTISPENQSAIKLSKSCICNIIPNGLYMKVTSMISGGKVYNSSNVQLYDVYKNAYDHYIEVKNDPNSSQTAIAEALEELNEARKAIYVFDTKIVNLNLKVYQGQNEGRTYVVNINKINKDNTSSSVYSNLVLTERIMRSISVPSEAGENIISISVSSGGSTSTFTYYYYVGESVNSLSFYHDRNGKMSSAIHNYFRAGDVTSAFSQYSLASYIDMKRNSAEKNITGTIETPSTISDVMISFGIQYSIINDTTSKIITISSTDISQTGERAGDITIYQNKITYNTGGGYYTSTIFLPKEENYEQMSSDKYHLLTIYKRFISKAAGNNNKYEIIIYLDGVIEAAIPAFVQENVSYRYIKLYNSNFSLNNVDVSYFTHTDAPNREETDTDLDDTYITQYYYAYLQYINSSKYNQNFVNILDYMGMLHENVENNGFIEVDNGETTINNIAKEINIPVLLLSIPKSSGMSFGNWFTTSYTEGAVNAGRRNVFVKYSNGKSTLQEINFPNELIGISFYIELQGSSTLRYRSKNLNLGVTSNEQYTVLYTPNLKLENADMTEAERKEAHNTFLPEQVFTLKADVSDSSHSNNTAVGSFVNTNTVKFETNQENSRYGFRSYIKNCLLGYPVLVFVEDNDFDPVRYYYLGIYNFNLGRDSYFNMGYYNVNILDDLTAVSIGGSSSEGGSTYHDGFGIYYGHTDNITLKPGLVISEIQGGNSYYDFSQFDNSLLFPMNPSDGHSMFGDFVPKYMASDGTIDGTKEQLVKSSIQSFVKTVSKAGGFIFERIGKKLPLDPDSSYGYNYGYNGHEPDSIYSSSNIVPNYKYQFERYFENESSTYKFRPRTNNPFISESEIDINNLKMAITDDDNLENPEYTRMLDYQSLVEYYTICMAFGLVDSVQKNLNIKSWTANATKTNVINGHVNPMFYIAFYDMDTCLGRDNAGKASAYFAFSDYWDARYKVNSSQSTATSTVYDAESVVVERDFYPRNDTLEILEVESGYDIPSSYLFAIAKYANLFNSSGAGQQIFGTLITPEELWATWRSPRDITTPASATNGELVNAKYFIDKYFIRNLDEIPEALFNYNYRFKYLVKQSTVFNPNDIESFHGRGIYELEDWLSGRFHILDAYFNITGIQSYMQYLDDDGKWSDYVYNGTKLPLSVPPEMNTKNNQDIYILNDIFATSNSPRKYSGNDIILTIQTRKLSPLIIQDPTQKSRYLFKNDNTKYHITYVPHGSVNISFLGSNLWTYIESINSLVPNDTTSMFYIKSEYLENLTGNSGTCSNWQIDLKSLRTVSLTSANYNGTLSFMLGENGTVDNYPNLDTIDISGSSISLVVRGEGITRVNCSNVGAGANTIDKYPNLELTECNALTSVMLTGSKLKECTIVPTWGKNVSITRSNIMKMTLAGKEDENGEYPSLTITGDSLLSELTISKYKSVNISGCPNLKTIIIQDSGILETLFVSGAYGNAEDLDVTGFRVYTSSADETPQPFTIDLSKQTAIKEIAFNENNGAAPTYGFTKVILPSYDVEGNEKEISLRRYAFSNTELQQIEFTEYANGNNAGTLVLGGRTGNSAAGIFYNTQYNVLTTYNIYNKMIVPANITTLEGTFGGNTNSQSLSGKLSTNSIQLLLGNYTSSTAESNKIMTYENIANIKNISYMFSSQTGAYTDSQFAAEYEAGYCRISIGRFVGAQTAEGIFGRLGNGSTVYLSEKFFEWTSGGTTTTFGQNVTEPINIANMFTATSIHLTKDTFRSIIDRVETLLYTEGYMSGSSNKYCFLRQCEVQEGRVVNVNVNCHDIFNPTSANGEVLHPTKLKTLCNVSFMCADGYKINFTNLFTPEWTQLSEILYCFYEEGLPEGSMQGSLNMLGLNNIRGITALNKSFMFNNTENMVNFGKFLNWESYINNITAFATGADYLRMHKYITRSDLYRLITYISNRSDGLSTMTGLQYLFQRTLIVINDANDNEFYLQDLSGVTDFYNTSTPEYRKLRKITDLSYTFMDMKMGYVKEYSTNIDDDTAIITLDKFNLVPIHMNSHSLFGLSNVKVMHSTFANINLEGNLPYNFFQKRIHASQGCYSETGEEMLLHYYTYDNVSNGLEDISSIFSNTSITINANKRRFRGFYVNDGEMVDENYLSDTSGNRLNVTKYKLTQSGELLDLTQNTEVTDYYEIRRTVHAYNNPTQIQISANSTIDIANFNYDESWKNITDNALLIFPPDILYGCSEGCIIDNAFARATSTQTTISTGSYEGILPTHLMKNLKAHTMSKPIYENLNVMPKKIFTVIGRSEDGTQTNTTVTNNVYLYIPNSPEYFSETSSYQGAFKFNLNIPAIEIWSNTNITYDSFYILGSQSVRYSNATSFKNSMPERTYQIVTYEAVEGNSKKTVSLDSHQRDFRTHYNMMLDTSLIETLGNTPNNGILHRTNDDANGLPTYILEDDISMDIFRKKFEGFDYGKFIGTAGTKSVDIDGLVNENLGAIYFGHLFRAHDDEYNTNEFKPANYASSSIDQYAIYLGGRNISVSSNLILPQSGDYNKFLKVYGNSKYQIPSTVTMTTTIYYNKIWQFQFADYDKETEQSSSSSYYNSNIRRDMGIAQYPSEYNVVVNANQADYLTNYSSRFKTT